MQTTYLEQLKQTAARHRDQATQAQGAHSRALQEVQATARLFTHHAASYAALEEQINILTANQPPCEDTIATPTTPTAPRISDAAETESTIGQISDSEIQAMAHGQRLSQAQALGLGSSAMY